MYKVAKDFSIGLVVGMVAGFLLFGCFSDGAEDPECSGGAYKCEGTEIYTCRDDFWNLEADCAIDGKTCSTDCYYEGITCCR